MFLGEYEVSKLVACHCTVVGFPMCFLVGVSRVYHMGVCKSHMVGQYSVGKS